MKKYQCLFLCGLIIIFLSGQVAPQNRVSILSAKEIRALNNEISGELAQESIRYIGHYERLQPSRGYHEAALWMVDAAKKAGLSDVHIEEYPSDGKIYYYMDKTSPAWDVEYGELWIVEPKEEKLTSFAEIPVSLAITSQSCDVKGELVFVGSGTRPDDYAKVDVKGKVVLAEGSIGTVANMAVDRFGALGVVVINQRYAYENPDIVSSIRIRTQTPTFGFGLSNRRGEELRNRVLRGEKIVVRAKVKTETHAWPLENVVATIPGTDLAHEEINLTAHLCHYKPGANDNASGSACILEVGRALRKLIDEGKIKQPRRTIRFLWVPENSGSIAFAATHPEIIERTVAGLNLDMVGQYLNDNNSTFFLHCTPHSRPHYINDLLINLTEFVAAHNVQALMGQGETTPVYSLSGSRDSFRYRIYEYVGGSDQWAYNAGLIGVPMTFFLVWPDHFYHTSGDKPEICDPTQLKRSSFLAAAAVIYLMDDCPHKARRLAGEVYTRAKSRIALETKRGFDSINNAETSHLHIAYKEAVNCLQQAYKREGATLKSLKNYSYRDKDVDTYIDGLVKSLPSSMSPNQMEIQQFYQLTCRARQITPERIQLTAAEQAAAKMIPKRNPDLRGPLSRGYIQEKLGPDANTNLPIFRVDGRITYEILNFIDGKNSVLDIRNAVSAEYEPVPLDWVHDFIDLLRQAEIVL